MVVKMTDIDVVLGMNFLAANHANIECRKKKVVFSPSVGPSFKFKGTNTKTTQGSLNDESKEISSTRRLDYINMCRRRKTKRKDPRKHVNRKRVFGCVFG